MGCAGVAIGIVGF